MAESFENQRAGAFAHHEAVALFVERPRGVVRVVVAPRKRSHIAETGQRAVANRRFGAAGDHRVGLAVLQEVESEAQRVRRRRAGRNRRSIRALRSGANRNVAGGHVRDHHRNQKGADAIRAFFDQLAEFALPRRQTANAAADDHANALGVGLVNLETGLSQRFVGRHDRQMDETIHPARFLTVNVVFDIEVFDFAAETGRVARGIHERQRLDAVGPAFDAFPEGRHPDAQRRHRAHPGDDDAFFCFCHENKILNFEF